jgi:hypothetical protein
VAKLEWMIFMNLLLVGRRGLEWWKFVDFMELEID